MSTVSDDEPRSVSFKDLRKKKLHLSENLQDTYKDGLNKIRASNRKRNDPRFDPRVHGVCHVEDWAFLEEEQKRYIPKLKKMLNKCKDPEEIEKIKSAMHLVKQRIATQNDIKFRKQIMENIQDEQMQKLQSGERVQFMNRSELKKLVQEKRLEKLTKKQRVKYMNRKERKHPHSGETK